MATIDQLRAGYNRLNRALIVGAGQVARSTFESLDSWREEDIPRFLELLDPQLTGIKRQAARLQETYYAQVAGLAGVEHEVTPTPSTELTTDNLRNGATTEEVYRRPFATTYANLAEGSTLTQALSLGGLRAAQLASTDTALAGRVAGFLQRAGNPRIQFYRRTLTGAENCALCTIASTQRYRRGNLRPIHPGCDCGEEPFFGDEATPQIIDPDRLYETHEELWRQLGVDDPSARDAGLQKVIESGEGRKLADFTEIVVESNHGEYGPTLRFRDQNFTTLSDI